MKYKTTDEIFSSVLYLRGFEYFYKNTSPQEIIEKMKKNIIIITKEKSYGRNKHS